MKTLILMLQFFTVIPIPVKIEFNEKNFARGIPLLPVIGLFIGFIMAGVYYLFSFLHHDMLSVLVTIFAGVLITGGLHIDGFSDTCDGVLSHRSRERMLEIMKDPRLGTYGGLGLFFLFFFKFVLLMCLSKSIIIKSVILMPVLGRMSAVWSAGLSTYARKEGGMGGTTIINPTGKKEIIISTLLAGLIAYFTLNNIGIITLIGTIIFTIVFTKYICSKIGGTTGDTIGASVELSETVFLFLIILIERLIF